MPHNLQELRLLLESTSQKHLNALGSIIGTPFGNSPELICDHVSFLRHGTMGQLFDKRDYKQLVTDVADRVRIDWSRVIQGTTWAEIDTEQIESAIVHHVDPELVQREDQQHHLDPPVSAELKALLLKLISNCIPVASFASPLLDHGIDYTFSLLSTDWQKLLAALIYINEVIRPSLISNTFQSKGSGIEN
ncbi:MAG: hypothetical protein KME45_19565 [Stenomitos rutilans HA7619-LM2]|jgi:hypothetical protein|nr:hypothetical protein [Stenomitos rutilans HA7619-LM2]